MRKKDNKDNNDIIEEKTMENENEKEKNTKKTKKRLPSPGKIAVKVIALLMAFSMIFAVAASCIFYVMYYLK